MLFWGYWGKDAGLDGRRDIMARGKDIMSVPGQFYLAQVAICARSAAHCLLANERDKYLRAQAAWQAIADREAGVQAAREARDAQRAAAPIDM